MTCVIATCEGVAVGSRDFSYGALETAVSPCTMCTCSNVRHPCTSPYCPRACVCTGKMIETNVESINVLNYGVGAEYVSATVWCAQLYFQVASSTPFSFEWRTSQKGTLHSVCQYHDVPFSTSITRIFFTMCSKCVRCAAGNYIRVSKSIYPQHCCTRCTQA